MTHIPGDPQLAAENQTATRGRYAILALLFMGVTINYLDRTNLAVAAPVMQADLGITDATLGFIFAAFGWAYALMQVPAGIILDKLGTRKTFGWSLTLWSGCTCLFGLAGGAVSLLMLRLALGVTESPAFASINRAVTAWFPVRERGMAVGVYVSGEFIGLALCTPLLAWAVVHWGWQSIFFLTGGLGLFCAVLWFMNYSEPRESKKINQAELAYLEEGGALTELKEGQNSFNWNIVWRLVMTRKLWGVYLSKFCQGSTLFFFFTWFPSYLVREKGMDLVQAGLWSMLPFTAAMGGVLLSGFMSDYISRSTGNHTLARKAPIICGMALCSLLFVANYLDRQILVIAILSLAFFGQGMAGIIESLICDMAPAENIGTAVGICQLFANVGGMITPVVIGFIVHLTGSYFYGLIYVSAVAALGVAALGLLIGKVERVEAGPAKK